MARDATSAMVANDMADSAIIRSLALTVSGNVSAGENAVALVKGQKQIVDKARRPAGVKA